MCIHIQKKIFIIMRIRLIQLQVNVPKDPKFFFSLSFSYLFQNSFNCLRTIIHEKNTSIIWIYNETLCRLCKTSKTIRIRIHMWEARVFFFHHRAFSIVWAHSCIVFNAYAHSNNSVFLCNAPNSNNRSVLTVTW